MLLGRVVEASADEREFEELAENTSNTDMLEEDKADGRRMYFCEGALIHIWWEAGPKFRDDLVWAGDEFLV